MTVLFYTATCYLDISIEIINVLKNQFQLHVIIEITNDSKNNTISDVIRLPDDKVLAAPSEVLSKKSMQYFEPYFEGTKSVFFAVHKKKGFITSAKTSYYVWRHIKKIRPDVLHMEALLARSIGILPSLMFCKRLILSIHDPLPHSGEKDWKIDLIKTIFFKVPMSKGYLFYSHFAKTQFEAHYKNLTDKKWVIRMKPYSYFKNYSNDQVSGDRHILFFGRISKYKGVDVLLNAIPEVLDQFPNDLLVIAGRPINGYSLDDDILNRYPDRIKVFNKHISNSELVKLINDAKIIICPYVDATQSGVLMTAFALNRSVIGSNVGAFPEYIEVNKNGLLTPPGDHRKLSEQIKTALKDDFYRILNNNIMENSINESWHSNRAVFFEAYAL